MRFLLKIIDILKSLSFLGSSSQEEPLHSVEPQNEELTKAMNLLTQAAEQHNPDALYLLGHLNFVRPILETNLHKYGNYSQPNYKEAFKWFAKLTDISNNATAQHLIGFMYATGLGGAVEPNQGAVLFLFSENR